ncbi:MAG: PqqD family peptide modification chaperone, partial [Gaiellaceae bacterium]
MAFASSGSTVARRPRATPGLDVNETEDGLVIYTAANDKVHHLNNTAAVIFQLCDGSTDESAIVAAVAAAFDLAEPPIEETRSRLAELEREGLIA